jgi:serine/threonine protein kinase
MATPLLAPGTRVGRYEVVAHLASGGMGEVYRARDVELDRDVALKILGAQYVDNPLAVERFRREARNAARLAHKHIVTLYDWGQDGGTWFLALELIDGTDLHSYINARGRLRPPEAWVIIMQAAKALDHAFQQGIVHRDIKPSNFLISRRGRKIRVKLTDLGLSRALTDDAHRVTRDGTTVGTVDYMAPEQARDSALADVRSDIYSLGCTLYHLLAGQPPFPEGGLGERILKHLQTEPPDVRDFNREVPAGLWDVLRRMLAKEPDDRYQTPAELLEALNRVDFSGPTLPAPGPDKGPIVRRPAPDTSGDGAPPLPTCAMDAFKSEGALVSDQHRRAAATQFERAREVMTSGERDKRYAYDLLMSCCLLDPTNTLYRQELRRAAQRVRQEQRLAWGASPQAVASARARVESAREAGDHRKVLEHGEAALARSPGDVATHLDMAEAAARLGLPQLRIWLLQQACKEVPADPAPLQALALAHEQHKQLAKAIAVWQSLRKLRPDDAEAARRLNTLLRLLARAYERQGERGEAIAVWQGLLKLQPNDPEATRQINALSLEDTARQ